jgi:Flp pilus assembly pilin Flp
VVTDSLKTQEPNRSKDRGAGLIEAALLIGLVALVCVVSVRTLGHQVEHTLCKSTAEKTEIGIDGYFYWEDNPSGSRCVRMNGMGWPPTFLW